MKLSQRTAEQFDTLVRATQELHQLDEAIQADMTTLPKSYRQALEDGDLNTLSKLYTQWSNNHTKFVTRFEDFNHYSSRSLIDLWRNLTEETNILATTAGVWLTVVCFIADYYILSAIFIGISIFLVYNQYQKCLERHPYRIYTSHLDDEQRQILHEYTQVRTQAQMGGVRDHELLLDSSAGKLLNSWRASQDMQWDSRHCIYHDFKERTLNELRSSYIDHWIRHHS